MRHLLGVFVLLVTQPCGSVISSETPAGNALRSVPGSGNNLSKPVLGTPQRAFPTRTHTLFVSQENGPAAADSGSEGDPRASLPQLVQLARKHLRGGQVADAMRLLGEAADLDLPLEDGIDDGLASAAAGLHRRIARLDSEERFELLRAWSMPTDSRRTVRVLTTITPTLAPPPVFARVLGERPRRDSFAVPAIGEVRGLFSTAWSLVAAADECGRLRRLTADVSALVEEDVPNSQLLLTLIKIVAATREDEELRDALREYAARIGQAEGGTVFEDDLAVAAACLTQDGLVAVGESILKTKLEQTYGAESLRVRPFLRYAHATAIRKRYGNAADGPLPRSDLQLWLPSSTTRVWPSPQGSVHPLWLSDKDHILHAFGPRNDYLFFKYPLTGEFEFSCETQLGGAGGTDGCVAYGGLGYEVWSARNLAKIWDSSFQKLTEFHCPFVLGGSLPTFNRFSLKSTPDGITFAANGHPIWVDTSKGRASPWIGLRSFGERVPIFRNFKLVGNPVIPRQVNLSAGGSLRGWVSDYYGESTPPPPEQVEPGVQAFFRRMLTSYDWSAGDARPVGGEGAGDTTSGGMIHGAKRAGPNEITMQSRLYYLRPLQNGESISYEFEYQPGQLEVHPALGRIAFLIEPAGVRLHWMTDGEQEWTGLPEDNAVAEPLNRRGPKPLPLVAGEWNRMTVELARDKLTLSLNETQIYTRKMEPEIERTFGLYHDKKRSAVRVRNVVLRGDWPEQLTAEQRNNLAAATEPARTLADRRLLGAIFADRQVHGSVLAVRRQAAELPPEKRYAFLSDWVLPNADHHRLRLALDFTPTNPAPPVSDGRFELRHGLPARAVPARGAPGVERSAPPDTPAVSATPAASAKSTQDSEQAQEMTRVATGGDLVAPALDLVAVAKELGQLKTLRQRVSAISVGDDAQQRRSRLAMLALIDMAAGDVAASKPSLDELVSIVSGHHSFSFSERWPETLAIWEATRYSETRDVIRDMAFDIMLNQNRRHHASGSPAWDQHMPALASRINHFDLLAREPTLRAASKRGLNGQSPLANWVPASRATGRTRGQGFPRAYWAMAGPATVQNFASHDDDYLFYRSPLRGNFEVECDVSGFGYRELNLWVAGRWVAPVYTLRHVDIGDFRESQRLPLDPPIHKPDAWIRYRAIVRDGVCTTYANGREIHRRVLDAEYDPWLAIRSLHQTNGAVRNLRITGDPQIPDAVRLTANADLPGWLPINYGHQVGRKWQQLGDLENGGGIRGIHWPSLPGSHWETLLRYHRPMAEDGSIEYEFFYREGETHVHPALDRLAFMLQPQGVGVHWVGDEQFDRSGLPPDNLFDEPDNRRGPETLPLKLDDWNRLQLSLAGNTVRLTLNGALIYERQLESTNQRTFGLFHYADRTEALVRNVVWRGDWPRQLPAIPDQELAGEGMDFLDGSHDELAAVFHHDFAQDGFSRERFGLLVGSLEHFDSQTEGLRVVRPGGEGYNDTAIVPRLTIHGDFDMVLAFDEFECEASAGGSGGVFLQAIMDSEKSNQCLIYRRYLRHRAEPQPIVQGQYVGQEVGGARRSHFVPQVVEARAGRLRLARRGATVYFLFAENDSPHFRLFGTETAPTHDIRQLKLMIQTHLEGMTKVVWKSLTVRADALSGLALQDQNKVVAQLNKQRDTLAQRFEHDFAKDTLTEDRFESSGVYQKVGDTGAKVISMGRDGWAAVGLNPAVGLAGDFDASVTFDELKLAKPKEKQNSTMYLQVEFADPKQTYVNLLLVVYVDGQQKMYAQIRETDEGGNRIYRRIGIDEIDEVVKLRLVRRGKRFSFLFRPKGADQDQILAQTDSLDLPVAPRKLHWFLHTGGAGRKSEVLLKQFHIHAEKLDPNPAETNR